MVRLPHMVPWQDPYAPHSYAPFPCPLHQKCTHQRPTLGLVKGSGCAWRHLGRSCLGWCHQVWVWKWAEPEVCWGPLAKVALGRQLHTQLCPANKNLWTLNHSLVTCHPSVLWKSSWKGKVDLTALRDSVLSLRENLSLLFVFELSSALLICSSASV